MDIFSLSSCKQLNKKNLDSLVVVPARFMQYLLQQLLEHAFFYYKAFYVGTMYIYILLLEQKCHFPHIFSYIFKQLHFMQQVCSSYCLFFHVITLRWSVVSEFSENFFKKHYANVLFKKILYYGKMFKMCLEWFHQCLYI